MPKRTNGGAINDQMLTGGITNYYVSGADFSHAIDAYGKPVPDSAAEEIFQMISERGFINIMNPTPEGLSFALEGGRSEWNEFDLTAAIRAMGPAVGIDMVNCTACVVTEVPYNWGLGGGAIAFTDLTDVPHTFAGAAGFNVTVNPAEDGLIFVPSGTAPNAFVSIASTGQTSVNAIGATVLNLEGDNGTNISTNPATKTVTISNLAKFAPITGGNNLSAGYSYFVTSAGVLTLPALVSVPAGSAIVVSKDNAITCTISASAGDLVATDLGSDANITYDASSELIFIANGATWALQVGSQ